MINYSVAEIIKVDQRVTIQNQIYVCMNDEITSFERECIVDYYYNTFLVIYKSFFQL